MEKDIESKSSIVKVAIVGPESTGKSTLATELAKHFETEWVPEYARDYLDNLDRSYTEEDLLNIARGQVYLEDKLLRRVKKLLICDTNLIVIKIWSEHKYGHCDASILKEINRRYYDMHFLTGIDIPWEYDPQREHPHWRKYFYNKYYQELKTRNWPFLTINGSPEERLQTAISVIKSLL